MMPILPSATHTENKKVDIYRLQEEVADLFSEN